MAQKNIRLPCLWSTVQMQPILLVRAAGDDVFAEDMLNEQRHTCMYLVGKVPLRRYCGGGFNNLSVGLGMIVVVVVGIEWFLYLL